MFTSGGSGGIPSHQSFRFATGLGGLTAYYAVNYDGSFLCIISLPSVRPFESLFRLCRKNAKNTRKCVFFAFGGSGGIRTPVGLHPNGFQDRLVVTASIRFLASAIFSSSPLFQPFLLCILSRFLSIFFCFFCLFPLIFFLYALYCVPFRLSRI